jgi:TATA-box binding protein (TBP) (component of TFIID and TFIIIB)
MSFKSKTQTNLKSNSDIKGGASIDDEWASFLMNSGVDTDTDTDDENVETDDMHGLDDTKLKKSDKTDKFVYLQPKTTIYTQKDVPEPTTIYISTKSKIAYLKDPINLKIFWNIPVIPYSTPTNGVIKKQIKFNSKTPEELEDIQEKLKRELFYEQQVLSHIDNPSGRIKFKDIRKISIGISKKDITTFRSKKKQAFYNCFVIIIRIKFEETFKEFHIKVFNTGKLEIPGVQNDDMFEMVLVNIMEILQPHVETKLEYKQTSDTVLINSNFNCRFYINREALYEILKYKYNIQAIYDPCSYPGIQCKFYYNKDSLVQDGCVTHKLHKKADKLQNKIIEVSFMVFRTGSVLIVGMCEEYVLYSIYEFLVNLFKTQFLNIVQHLVPITDVKEKDKKKKMRRKIILIDESIKI